MKTRDQYLVLSLAAAQHQGGSRVEDDSGHSVGGLAQFLSTVFPSCFSSSSGELGTSGPFCPGPKGPCVNPSSVLPLAKVQLLWTPGSPAEEAKDSSVNHLQGSSDSWPGDMRLLHLAGVKMHAESFLNT